MGCLLWLSPLATALLVLLLLPFARGDLNDFGVGGLDCRRDAVCTLNLLPRGSVPNGQGSCPVTVATMQYMFGGTLGNRRFRCSGQTLSSQAKSRPACQAGCVYPYVPYSTRADLAGLPQLEDLLSVDCVESQAGNTPYIGKVTLSFQHYECRKIPQWPVEIMGPNNRCTNPIPTPGEACYRACSVSTDCATGFACKGGVCMCNVGGFQTDPCGPGKFCIANPDVTKNFQVQTIFGTYEYGFCVCDPNSPSACGGSGAGACRYPTVYYDDGDGSDSRVINTGNVYTYANSAYNLEWAAWFGYPTILPTQISSLSFADATAFATATRAAYSAFYPTRSWDVGILPISDGPQFAYFYAGEQYEHLGGGKIGPPLCDCKSGYHGAHCDQVIDQCDAGLCNGKGSCVVKAALGQTTNSYVWATHSADNAGQLAGQQITASATAYPFSTVSTQLYCNCSAGLLPFDITRVQPSGHADADGHLIAGYACTRPDNRLFYCNDHGTVVGPADSRCICDKLFSGPSCADECGLVYCSGRGLASDGTPGCTQVPGACTNPAGCSPPFQKNPFPLNMCLKCSKNFGPAQTTARDDVLYKYRWCGLPFSYDPILTQDWECGGRGFAVDLSSLLTTFQWNSLKMFDNVSWIDTHPLGLKATLGARSPPIVITDAQVEAYRVNVYNQPHPKCVKCDDGYRLSQNASSCITDDCKPWTQCHPSDVTCLTASGGPTFNNAKCGNSATARLSRGQCIQSQSGASFQCQCSDGFSGSDCGEVRCSWANGLPCSGAVNGYCDVDSNRCICQPGRVGVACEIPVQSNICNGNGQVARVNPPAWGVANSNEPSPYVLADDTQRTVWY